MEFRELEKRYKCDLRRPAGDLANVYWTYTQGLFEGKPIVDYHKALSKPIFSAYVTVYDDLINKCSDLASDLERWLFIDTSSLRVAINNAKQQKAEAEICYEDKQKHREAIQMLRTEVNKLSKEYNNWKAKKVNLKRTAIVKWGGVLGGVYTFTLIAYFYIINYLKIEPAFFYAVTLPLFLFLLEFGGIYAIIYSQQEEE